MSCSPPQHQLELELVENRRHLLASCGKIVENRVGVLIAEFEQNLGVGQQRFDLVDGLDDGGGFLLVEHRRARLLWVVPEPGLGLGVLDVAQLSTAEFVVKDSP